MDMWKKIGVTRGEERREETYAEKLSRPKISKYKGKVESETKVVLVYLTEVKEGDKIVIVRKLKEG